MDEKRGVFVTIRRLVAPPHFEGDEEKNRVATLINATLWTMLAVALLSLPSLWLTAGPERGLPLIGAFALIVVSMLFLLHRGQVGLAGALYAFFMFGVGTYVMSESGGATSPAVGVYVVCIGKITPCWTPIVGTPTFLAAAISVMPGR